MPLCGAYLLPRPIVVFSLLLLAGWLQELEEFMAYYEPLFNQANVDLVSPHCLCPSIQPASGCHCTTPLYNAQSMLAQPTGAACTGAATGAQVVSGHVHSYERSFPLSNYTVDTCGPTCIGLGEMLALWLAAFCGAMQPLLSPELGTNPNSPRVSGSTLEIR